MSIGPRYPISRAVFHGVGCDYTKVPGILREGILSEDAARERGIALRQNSPLFNGASHISVAVESPLDADYALNRYIRSAIAFEVAGIVYSHESPMAAAAAAGAAANAGVPNHSALAALFKGYVLPGEAFVHHSIPRSAIRRVLVPAGLQNRCLSDIGPISERGVLRDLPTMAKILGGAEDDHELRDLVRAAQDISNSHEPSLLESQILAAKANAYLARLAGRQLGVANPTLGDFIRHHVPSELLRP